MEMINLNLENEGIDEEVDVFNTVLPSNNILNATQLNTTMIAFSL
jgi:hypothetical protein